MTRDYHNSLPYDYKKYENYDFRKTHSKFVPYFNPSFVEREHKPDFYRYPSNPFKYTDHEHYFKNYYSGLRSSYYDKYYHSSPEKGKHEYSQPATHYENTSRPYGNYQTSQEEPLRFYQPKYSSRATTGTDFYKANLRINNENVNSNRNDFAEVSASSFYKNTTTPNSKREGGINFEKPKSAIKIEESKLYQPSYPSFGQNANTHNQENRLFSSLRDQPETNAAPEKRESNVGPEKSYKFANNQYESLWNENNQDS